MYKLTKESRHVLDEDRRLALLGPDLHSRRTHLQIKRDSKGKGQYSKLGITDEGEVVGVYNHYTQTIYTHIYPHTLYTIIYTLYIHTSGAVPLCAMISSNGIIGTGEK